MTAKELSQKIMTFSRDYFLMDVRNDRENFYALTKKALEENYICICGIIHNLILDGELEKALELIESIPDDFPIRILKPGLKLVHPQISWKEFITTINSLKKADMPLNSAILTAGRPYLLNGFNDFTRIGPLLEKYKALFMEDLKILYEGECVPFIYKLCLAEYKYQTNNLLDAEVLVSQTIKSLDMKSERRLLFVALYLQSKILLAHDKIIDTENFIKNIKDFVKEKGKAEFSYNIDAAEILFSLYEGNSTLVSKWLESSAPNEFTDFNMLDLYRYMIKIRCYIVFGNYAAVVSLAEKLRPLLEMGKRHADICELDILLSMAFYRAEKKELAFKTLEQALKVVRRRKYYRLAADEGETMLHLLIDYVNEKGNSDFLMMLIDMTREMAIAYPLYLKLSYSRGKTFSQIETDILKLLEQGKSKEEIGEYFFISVNTVKYHLKKIYAKLEVNTAHHAVWEARIQKII